MYLLRSGDHTALCLFLEIPMRIRLAWAIAAVSLTTAATVAAPAWPETPTHPCTPVGLEHQQHEAEAACLRLARLGQMLDGKTGAALQPTIKVQEECRVMGINALRDIQTRDGMAAVGANERALAEADPKVMAKADAALDAIIVRFDGRYPQFKNLPREDREVMALLEIGRKEAAKRQQKSGRY